MNCPQNQEAHLEKEKTKGWQAVKKSKTNPKVVQGLRKETKKPIPYKITHASSQKKKSLVKQTPPRYSMNRFSPLVTIEEAKDKDASEEATQTTLVAHQEKREEGTEET